MFLLCGLENLNFSTRHLVFDLGSLSGLLGLDGQQTVLKVEMRS